MRLPFAINSQSSHLVGRSCSYHTLIQTILLQLGGHCSFPMNIAAPLNPASAGVTPSWSKENSSGAQYRQQQFSSEVGGESPAISNRVTWNTCAFNLLQPRFMSSILILLRPHCNMHIPQSENTCSGVSAAFCCCCFIALAAVCGTCPDS